jgi:glucose-fructose oxidoreductase
VRYAVVGLGYIAQAAVLPAFAHARKNSELTALVSDDPVKLRQLARRYRVANTFSYEEYADCLASGIVDAVYIALPNSLHRTYSEEAAAAGIHVLCEKPMALTEEECESMIRTAEEHDVRLMIAYRLHFEAANLAAMEIVRSGKLGEPRIFNSLFTMNVKEGDIRLDRELGGGTLYDIGIYCIQAARHIFGEEPIEVFAAPATREEARFAEVAEMVAATLRFPQDQLASFTTSFGGADVSRYEVVGTKGSLRLDPAYEHSSGLTLEVTIGSRTKRRTYPQRDQFAPELIAFSDAVLSGTEVEPSGYEGMRDVRIIRALLRSAEIGKPHHLSLIPPPEGPSSDQEIRRPPVRKPELVHAESPSSK